MEAVNMKKFFTGFTDKLEPSVRHHLKNVYATVTIAGFCAAAGGYCHLFSTLIGASFLTSIGALVTLVTLMMVQDNGKNQKQRLALLASFAFLSGCNLGPLMEVAIHVNPTIIMEALLGTTVVFACFTLASLHAPQGTYLYLGGALMSMLSTLCVLAIFNIFIGSVLLFKVHLYLGLLVMCGFIMYDTQMIIEKCRRGNKDYITHAVELFIDFIAIFKKLLIILTDKESNRNNKRKN